MRLLPVFLTTLLGPRGRAALDLALLVAAVPFGVADAIGAAFDRRARPHGKADVACAEPARRCNGPVVVCDYVLPVCDACGALSCDCGAARVMPAPAPRTPLPVAPGVLASEWPRFFCGICGDRVGSERASDGCIVAIPCAKPECIAARGWGEPTPRIGDRYTHAGWPGETWTIVDHVESVWPYSLTDGHGAYDVAKAAELAAPPWQRIDDAPPTPETHGADVIALARAAASAIADLCATLDACAREVDARGGQRTARDHLHPAARLRTVEALNALAESLPSHTTKRVAGQEIADMMAGVLNGYVRPTWALRVVALATEASRG